MLGFFPVKSVDSRDKIVYGKRKLAEICDAAKGKTWKSIECRQWQIFLSCHTRLYLFLKWQFFPKLQEYNQFHLFVMEISYVDFCAPVKSTKFWDFAAAIDNVLDVWFLPK